MTIDYQPFLIVASDGEIWWPVETAIKLAAGYVPASEIQPGDGADLCASSNRIRADERSILAALNQAHPHVKSPQIVVREGTRFVRAREFIRWLDEYGTAIQSRFHTPNELIRQMRNALAVAVPPTDAGFQSLEKALEGWFDRPLDELPDDKRQRIDKEFFSMPWNLLDGEQRRSAAAQLDYQNDPVTYREQERAFNLWCDVDDVETQIREVELLAARTPLERESKIRQLKDLKVQLNSTRAKAEKDATDGNATVVPTVKGEKDCQAWLTNLMKQANPEQPKSAYWTEANKKFTVSRRGFSRAWANAVVSAGNAAWQRPGRKSKRRIDTPK